MTSAPFGSLEHAVSLVSDLQCRLLSQVTTPEGAFMTAGVLARDRRSGGLVAVSLGDTQGTWDDMVRLIPDMARGCSDPDEIALIRSVVDTVGGVLTVWYSGVGRRIRLSQALHWGNQGLYRCSEHDADDLADQDEDQRVLDSLDVALIPMP